MQSIQRIVGKSIRYSTNLSRALSTSMSPTSYPNLVVSRPSEYVVHVQMNRPKMHNALNGAMWSEIGAVFTELADDESCRSIVLSGAGASFCAGIDLKDAMSLFSQAADDTKDVARKHTSLRKKITEFQQFFTAMEDCLKPVICCVHGACLGAGINMITACDIRYGSKDAVYCVKEVDLGLAADVGILARFQKCIGNASLIRELCYTGRNMSSSEAASCGLVSRTFDDKQATIDAGIALAIQIAAKSPVAVQGSKYHLNYARDHSVAESLEAVKLWNAAMLQSEDLVKAAMASISKGDAVVFAKL